MTIIIVLLVTDDFSSQVIGKIIGWPQVIRKESQPWSN